MYSSDLEDDEMDRASRKVVGWHMMKLEKQVQRLAPDFIHVISIPPSVVMSCCSRDRFITYSGSIQSLLHSSFYDQMFTNVPDLGAYTRCARKAIERDDAICQLSHL